MATRVKVKSFVASSARYAKKSARAADKNKNKKLTRAEGKSLPKDLRDDFKRQLGKKASVPTEKFARDQAAYVGAASKRADQNKDGVLSAGEAAKLPASLQDNFKSYEKSLAGGPGSTSATLTRQSTPVAQLALLGQMVANADGISSFIATWKVSPGFVADVIAHPDDHKDFLNHLLFESTGTSFEKDYPNYYSPQGLSVTFETGQAVVDVMGEDFKGNSGGDLVKEAAIDRDARALVRAFGEGNTFMKLSWTNNDDAWFSGVFAFNPRTGKIAGAGPYSEP